MCVCSRTHASINWTMAAKSLLILVLQPSLSSRKGSPGHWCLPSFQKAVARSKADVQSLEEHYVFETTPYIAHAELSDLCSSSLSVSKFSLLWNLTSAAPAGNTPRTSSCSQGEQSLLLQEDFCGHGCVLGFWLRKTLSLNE